MRVCVCVCVCVPACVLGCKETKNPQIERPHRLLALSGTLPEVDLAVMSVCVLLEQERECNTLEDIQDSAAVDMYMLTKEVCSVGHDQRR